MTHPSPRVPPPAEQHAPTRAHHTALRAADGLKQASKQASIACRRKRAASSQHATRAVCAPAAKQTPTHQHAQCMSRRPRSRRARYTHACMCACARQPPRLPPPRTAARQPATPGVRRAWWYGTELLSSVLLGCVHHQRMPPIRHALMEAGIQGTKEIHAAHPQAGACQDASAHRNSQAAVRSKRCHSCPACAAHPMERQQRDPARKLRLSTLALRTANQQPNPKTAVLLSRRHSTRPPTLRPSS
jgi:hypothetical protein